MEEVGVEEVGAVAAAAVVVVAAVLVVVVVVVAVAVVNHIFCGPNAVAEVVVAIVESVVKL